MSESMVKNKKGVIGILTGGGDVPGLNPAIRAVTFRAFEALLAKKRHPMPVLALSLGRLANAPGQASIALGGILAPLALENLRSFEQLPGWKSTSAVKSSWTASRYPTMCGTSRQYARKLAWCSKISICFRI